ncbi:MAG: SDR family oxidoreductase [Microbacteriaceae bacterium]|nr:SDR family oxidoreductase [Microbacteriaceae bacterium]
MESDAMTRAAIVTGATGGVGAATVEALLDRGYGVVAVDLAPPPAAWAEDERIVPLTADVSQEASAAEAVAAAETRFGRLDLLVNNAGLFLRKPIEHTSVDDLQRLLAVNVVGAFVFTRAAVPALARTRGAIVNLGSISGLVGTPGQSAYAITKGAIVQFTRQSAIEHAPLGIRVNAVAPGAIETEFMSKAVAAGSDPGLDWDELRRNNPLGRVSSAAEVADAIVWLAGAEAVSGEILSIDGGHTAR